jgi:putative hydrolase of the HAD superfamily
MIKLLTFDLDNTLWHVDEVIHRATKIKFDWLKENYPVINEKLNQQDFIDIRNDLIVHNPNILSDLSLLRILTIEKAAIKAGIQTKEAQKLAKQAFDIFFIERNKVALFPDTEAVLKALSEKFQLIALSNGNADLKVIGIDQYFSAHYKPVDAGAPKPSPKMFQLALKTAGVKAVESIHIGDDLVCDIEGAKALGFFTIFSNILNTHSPESEAMADVTIQHLNELPEAVAKLNPV